MEKKNKTRTNKIKSRGRKDIDIIQMLKAVWKHLWVVILVAALTAGLAYAGAKLFVKPTYRSSFSAYVNNKKEVDASLNSSDVAAAKSIAKTYMEIITCRNVLNDAAKEAGVELSYGQLKKMVSTSISNETEIITVHVVTTDPELSFDLARAIEKKAEDYAPTIVDGSSMKPIDDPVLSYSIYQPSYVRVALLGALVGFLISVIIICIRQFTNDVIGNESEFAEHYSIPIVGVIPDIMTVDKSKGGYYYYYGHSGE